MTKPFIILDRDGVINYDSAEYIKSPEEWHPIPGSLEAIADLNRAGFDVVIATNQSGIGRGLYTIEMLDRIHEKLMHELSMVGGFIKEFFFCPHIPEDHCICRKPNIGLFQNIQKKYSVVFSETFFIGDSLVDMQAARSIGCHPLLVLTGNGEKTLAENPDLSDHIQYFKNLAYAAEFVLASMHKPILLAE